jgi:hypothetical protein
MAFAQPHNRPRARANRLDFLARLSRAYGQELIELAKLVGVTRSFGEADEYNGLTIERDTETDEEFRARALRVGRSIFSEDQQAISRGLR